MGLAPGMVTGINVACMSSDPNCAMTQLLKKHFLDSGAWDGMVPALFAIGQNNSTNFLPSSIAYGSTSNLQSFQEAINTALVVNKTLELSLELQKTRNTMLHQNKQRDLANEQGLLRERGSALQQQAEFEQMVRQMSMTDNAVYLDMVRNFNGLSGFEDASDMVARGFNSNSLANLNATPDIYATRLRDRNMRETSEQMRSANPNLK